MSLYREAVKSNSETCRGDQLVPSRYAVLFRLLDAACRHNRAVGGPADIERLVTLASYTLEAHLDGQPGPAVRERSEMVAQILRRLLAHFTINASPYDRTQKN